MLIDRFALNPDPFYSPRISISPFSITGLHESHSSVPGGQDFQDFLLQQWKGFIYCDSGKKAIEAALLGLNINRNHLVTIVTSSQNSYISKCVTESIERFCDWNMEITEHTTHLYVIHDFGFLAAVEVINNLEKLSIPIIHDFAYSALSLSALDSLPYQVDIGIFSLPKFLPMNLGGILVFNDNEVNYDRLETSNRENIDYLLKGLASNEQRAIASQARINNYYYLLKFLNGKYFQEYFTVNPLSFIPGVAMFAVSKVVDLAQLKVFMNRQGVESSVFYGKNAFFVPVHDRLTENELEYIATALNHFVMQYDQ